MPAADNPKDYDSVMKALDDLAKKLNRELTTITVFGQKLPLLGLTLNKNAVNLHTPEGDHVSYKTLFDSLGSIVDAV